MEPRNWLGASVDSSVLRRLRRLDPKLKVTYSPYALDPTTGNPIVMDGYAEDGRALSGPLTDPCFYLWRKSDRSGWVLVQQYPAETGFGNPEVLRLEADLARYHSPDEVWRIAQGRIDAIRERQARAKKDAFTDRVMDNKKLVMDVASGKPMTREVKTFGYAGQSRRTSSGESSQVQKSREELGIRD